VNGVDDLGVVDPAQVHGRDPEVGMPELPLYDDERNALARHLDSVSMPELMGRKPPTHPGGGRRIAQLDTNPGG
jgi:TRAP-type C4-dicarboxylate transport system substrate-binding protein